VEEETELQVRSLSAVDSTHGYIRRKTSQLFEAVSFSSQSGDKPLSPRLMALVDAYTASDIATSLRSEIDAVAQPTIRPGGTTELPDVAVESTLLRGRKRASWTTQFRILSGRAFKNLYRDPALLASHYIASIALACELCALLLGPVLMLTISVICGLFYRNVSNDIGGFQNLLGALISYQANAIEILTGVAVQAHSSLPLLFSDSRVCLA